MATTIENLYVGDGSTVLYSFTFPYITSEDVQVSLDGTLTTAYTFANVTTVEFDTAPLSGVAIRIYRDTQADDIENVFYPGSAIRAKDLNDNFTQSLYVIQEADINVAASNQKADTALANSEAAVITANAAETSATAAQVAAAQAAQDAADANAVQIGITPVYNIPGDDTSGVYYLENQYPQVLDEGLQLPDQTASWAVDNSIRINTLNEKLEVRIAGDWTTASAGAEVSPTPPSPATQGDVWYDPSDGRAYVYYTDSDSSQWVEMNPSWNGSIADNVVTTPKLVNGSVTPAKLDRTYVEVGDTYWDRTGTTLSPKTAGDSVDIGSGNISLNADGSATFAADATINSLTIGRGAGNISTNTANGYVALYNNTTGYNNTANGYQALYSNTTGSGNTANGYRALYSNDTGYNNTANGINALFSNTTGSSNTANGYQALYSNDTGANNVANGREALYFNDTGSSNVANGYQVLYSNTTGASNTATGYRALFSNTTGSSNTANGYQALYFNDTGYNNVANGYQALYFNDTGYNNVANGYNALRSNTTGANNTADGVQALYSNTTGNYNVANGRDALYSNETGYNNVANGYRAGYYIEGNNNTVLGAYKGTAADATLNDTIILSAGTAEKLRIDSTGSLLFGGTLPSAPNIALNASGSATFAGDVEIGTTGSVFRANGLSVLNRNTSTTGDYIFQMQAGGVNQFRLRANGSLYLTNINIQPLTSERRLKENIVAIESVEAWETVKSTPYYAYNFIGSDSVVYGPMADEVPDEMRVATDRTDDVGVIHTYDNGMLQARLYTALQTALTRIEALEAKVTQLEGGTNS